MPIYINISAVKQLIAKIKIQNKSFCSYNIWVCTVYIYYVHIRGGRKKNCDSLSKDSGSILRITESILSLVFNQMCDDAEFALGKPVLCLLPIPHTNTPLEPFVK